MKGIAASALAAVVTGAFAMVPNVAFGQCRGRPTDASGFQGFSYAADEVKTYATPAFKVHYAVAGKHAPDPATTRPDAVPDAVAFAGDTAEGALAKFTEMGFKKPPSDLACTSNGGDAKTDIYLVSFAGADGSTASESCTGAACASFFLVDATFKNKGYKTPQEGFRTVVTHELFHGVQNAYNADMDRFWAEGTAQWAMKTVHPDLEDFERQLPAFFAEPRRSLDTPPSGVTAGFLYGSAVWPLYLSLRHGASTVREILEVQGEGATAIPATEVVLGKKGSSMADAFPLFAAWNVATKGYAGVGGYPEAAKYPGVKAAALEEGASGITSGHASFAYVGTLDARSKIALETDETRNAAVVVPLEGGKARLDLAVKAPANIAAGEVLVVVAGITSKKTDAPFAIRLLPPDPEVGGSSSGGGASAEDPGCAVVRGVNGGPRVPGGALALGLAAFFGAVLRSNRLRRSRRTEAR